MNQGATGKKNFQEVRKRGGLKWQAKVAKGVVRKSVFRMH